MGAYDFDNCVATRVPAGRLTKLYAQLDNEDRPYELHVCKPDGKRRSVKIYCNDAAYFNNLLNGYKA